MLISQSLTPLKALTHIISSYTSKQNSQLPLSLNSPNSGLTFTSASAFLYRFDSGRSEMCGIKHIWKQPFGRTEGQEWNEGGRHKICSLSAASCWKSHRAGLPPAYSQQQVYLESDLRECIKRPLERKGPKDLEIISVFIFVTENKQFTLHLFLQSIWCCWK